MAEVKGETTRVYLAAGTPAGVLTAEIINPTRKVIVASRNQAASMRSLAAAQSDRFLGVIGQRSVR